MTYATVPPTQKAAQYDPKLKKVVINTIPVPVVVHDEILVKITSASLCHSDMLLLEGQFGAAHGGPVTMGHEAVGQVVEVGRTAAERGFKKGDYVGFINAYHACFECEGCRHHYINCTSGKMIMQGFASDGYFQEYCAIDSGVAVQLPPGLDPTTSSPIFCAGITAYAGVLTAQLSEGEWLGIVGCGGLGQIGIWYAKAMGYKVIGIDVDDATLQTAKESGADALFNSRTNSNIANEIKELTSGGCHACTVFTAVKAGYDTAAKVLRVGGCLVPVGIAGDITLNSFDLVMHRLYIRAASNATKTSDLTDCAEFTVKHQISSPSRFFKFEQINEMIDIMQGGKMAGYRLIVIFDD